MVYEGAPLTLDLEPLAGPWGPIVLDLEPLFAPWDSILALDLGPQSAPGAT